MISVSATAAVTDERFRPPWWLRSGHSQTLLPSLPIRRAALLPRVAALVAASRERIVDCGDGVRLQCFHATPRGADPADDLTVFVHGWEGSAESLYVLSAAERLFTRGHEVVRLNLRDHGETYGLNPELFHSCRLPEVIGAVRALRESYPGRRVNLVGFSLGGNFVLRVAADARENGLDIHRVVAISPVLDPARTLHALDGGLAVYQRYFIWKWTSSLRRKQAAWPDRYDFSELRGNLREMTDVLVRHHTDYPTLDHYLAGYAITGDRLARLEVPSLVVTSIDDPIIPADDLPRLARPPALRLVVTRYGGHCGFFADLRKPSYADELVVETLAGAAD